MEHAGIIYHITTPEAWRDVQGNDEYSAASLETEGFIHCSTADQVQRSLNRFYSEVPEAIVLAIDPILLTAELKYEPAHDELFPHIYGTLNLDAVVAYDVVCPGPDGTYSYRPNEA